MKKLGFLVAMLCAVGVLAFSASPASSHSFLTTTAIQRLQPFVSMQNPWDTTVTAGSGGVGGFVKYYVTKSTDTLHICDIAYIDTLNAVAHSTTLANYNKIAGVVIGGRSTNMQGSTAAADCGSVASLPGRPVIVLREGRFWIQNDANAGVTAGGLLIPSASVAGKARAATTAIDTLYRVFGRSILGGAVSTTLLAEISVK